MDPNEIVYTRLNEALQHPHDVPVFTLTAPIKAAVIIPDGSYRTKALAGVEEFFLRRVRGGKKDQMICEFEPVDSQPYSQMELNDRVAMDTFGNLEPYLAKILGGEEDTSFAAMKKKIRAEVSAEAKAAKAAEREAAENNYKDNPNWGMF
jgi:hypothetical protein